jgi:hypothetical protein
MAFAVVCAARADMALPDPPLAAGTWTVSTFYPPGLEDEDEGPHYMSYTDNSGLQHESFEAACIYYGADTPAQLAAEDAYEQEQFLDYCNEFDCFPAAWFPEPTAITGPWIDEDFPF